MIALDARRRARLALEALDGGARLRCEQFQREALARVQVFDLVDGAHAALADETDGAIFAADQGREVEFRHGRLRELDTGTRR